MARGYDDVYTKSVEARLKAIEDSLGQIWHLLQNTLSKEQFNRLNVIRQRQIAQIQDRITSLTTEITELEGKVDGLM